MCERYRVTITRDGTLNRVCVCEKAVSLASGAVPVSSRTGR